MAHDDFFILTVDGLTSIEADIFSAMAFENGASGITEDLPFIQTGEKYEPVTVEQDTITLKVYFETPPPARWLEDVKANFSGARFALHAELKRDWLAEWKKGFSAFPLDDEKTTWVVPSWLPVPAEAARAIRIDPGMAFGTGTHETTRLAAQLILKNKIYLEKFKSALDVGTGTGILAMLLVHIGIPHVIGNDVDPEARRVARENAEINQLADVLEVVDESVEKITGTFDVVVANIIDGVLVEIQGELKERVSATGHLILTGILEEREAGFLKNFEHHDFILIERLQVGEWVGFHFRRKSASKGVGE